MEDIDILSLQSNGVISYRQRIIRKLADYNYTPREQSVLFSAVAIGALLAIYPISLSIEYYGTRNTFAFVIAISASSTAFCPLAASYGTICLTFLRMIQGIGFACCMPLIGSVTSSWAQMIENGLFSGALTSFIQVLRRLNGVDDSQALSGHCHDAGTFACCLSALSRTPLIVQPGHMTFPICNLIDATLSLDARSSSPSTNQGPFSHSIHRTKPPSHLDYKRSPQRPATLGPAITMPLSGFLCATQIGWPLAFYIHSALTWIFLTIWWILYRDEPSKAYWVSACELRLISNGKVEKKAQRNDTKLPVGEIFATPSVWAIWVAAAANMYSIQMVVVFAPTYINQVLGLPVVSVGWTAALPTLLQFVIKILAGIGSDKITFLNETTKVRLFNTIAFFGMATFLIALAYTPTSRTTLALTFLISSTAILGFNTGGFFKSSSLVAQEFSYFINTIVQVVMCTAMLTVPFTVSLLTPNGSAEEWYSVFILHAVMLIFANLLFCKFGKGTVASFVRSISIAKDIKIHF
ncbi:unnamed protein product [Thelazia callipaeda]|uniref:MFS domain-containing protein n=1 Tax=Thelazia callipaeda TaxID=103827 RepID=A0A0N5D3R3_THECL|nr:unnamed protein product [Thelazia callipaeda]